MDAPTQANGQMSRQEQRSLELKDRMDLALEELAAQLARGHTDHYLRFLAFYSRFWTYSIRNTVLIHDQCPHATRCAGMRLWNSLGYHVKRGEHALWIWAPILANRPDEETGELTEQVIGFVPAPVFDASQLHEIEERPLPGGYPVLPDDAAEAYAVCVAKIRAQGIAVEERDDLEPGARVVPARYDHGAGELGQSQPALHLDPRAGPSDLAPRVRRSGGDHAGGRIRSRVREFRGGGDHGTGASERR